MRIFIVSYYSPFENHTSSNRIRYLGSFLRNNNYEVHFINAKDFKKIKIQGYWFKLFQLFRLVFFKSDGYTFLKEFKKKNFIFSEADLIICSGPPYSIFEIGYYIQKKYGSKFIMDYRDPWNLGYKTLGSSILVYKLRRIFTLKKEINLLQSCNAISNVCAGLIDYSNEKINRKIFIIENGANENEIKNSEINSRPKKFTLLYPGTLYKEQIKDLSFFECFKKFTKNKSANEIELQFLGNVDYCIFQKIIKRFGLENFVEIIPRVDLQEVYTYMKNAWMFILFPYPNSNKIPSSKIYDYLYLSKKILLTKNDNGILEKIIFENNSGYICENEEEIFNALELEYSKFLCGEDSKINYSKEQLNSFSRNNKNHKWKELIHFVNQNSKQL